MRLIAALAVLLLAESSAFVNAFVPATPSASVAARQLSATYKLGENDPNDLSIPYDSAARLAYDDWCRVYNKPFDAKRYETFKANYEAITIANVKAAKAARDAGSTDSAKKLDLNEYADMTAEEYMAMQSGGTTRSVATEEEEAPVSAGDVLGQAVEAAALQNDASAALAEAADALAEEELVRLRCDMSVLVSLCWCTRT